MRRFPKQAHNNLSAHSVTPRSHSRYWLQVDGNVWSVSILGKALFVGMLATIVPTAALFFFNDDFSLGVESEALGQLREPLTADSTGEMTLSAVPGFTRTPLIRSKRMKEWTLGTVPWS